MRRKYVGRHRGEYALRYRYTLPMDYPQACPICVNLVKWARTSAAGPFIRNATHGMTANGLHYRMCYPHFRVISAHFWAEVTHKYEELE